MFLWGNHQEQWPSWGGFVGQGYKTLRHQWPILFDLPDLFRCTALGTGPPDGGHSWLQICGSIRKSDPTQAENILTRHDPHQLFTTLLKYLQLNFCLFKEIAKQPAEITREEQLQNQLSQQLNLPGLLDSSTTAATPQPVTVESKVGIISLFRFWLLPSLYFIIFFF